MDLKQIKMSQFVVVFSIVFLLLNISFSSYISSHGQRPELDTKNHEVKSNIGEDELKVFNYTEHEPIKIDGNDEFSEKADSESWQGNGSEENPYIISGYAIGCDEYSIYLINITDYFVIKDCYMYGGGYSYSNLVLKNTKHGIIRNNKINDNYESCIALRSSELNYIYDNEIHDAKVAISIGGSYNNKIRGNRINDTLIGCSLGSSEEIKIYENNITDVRDSISLTSSNNNTIYDNYIVSNSEGVDIRSGWGNKIRNNIFKNNEDAIRLRYSQNTKVFNNRIIDSSRDGILIRFSTDISISNNTFLNDSIRILGTIVEEWNTHKIDSNNTINGKPIIYKKDKTGRSISTDFGQLILANCTGMTIKDNYVKNDDIGVHTGFSDNNQIFNNTFSDNTEGIYFYYSDNNHVYDNEFFGNKKGVYIRQSVKNNFSENDFYDNNIGVDIWHSDLNTVYGNDIISNRGKGIFVEWRSHNNILKSNFIKNNSDGVKIHYSDGIDVINNVIIDNRDDGLHIENSDYAVKDRSNITSNKITSNQNFGIKLDSYIHYDILFNNISKNGKGVHLGSSGGSNFTDNHISSRSGHTVTLNRVSELTMMDNEMYGEPIDFDGRDKITWTTNRVTNNTINGKPLYFFTNKQGGTVPTDGIQVILAGCSNMTLKDQYMDEGLKVGYSDNITVINNDISDTDETGILIQCTRNSRIANNTLVNCSTGIWIDALYKDYPNKNIISDNILKNNEGSGILLYHTIENRLFNNELRGDGLHIGGRYKKHYNTHVIAENNTIDGEKVIYWKNRAQGIIKEDAGIVILANCTDVNVEGIHAGSGIHLGFCDDVNITNNRINDTEQGISLDESDNNLIQMNELSEIDRGIIVDESEENVIKRNKITNNRRSGLFVDRSYDNKILSNMILNNSIGLMFMNAEENMIYGNNIEDNGYGLSLSFFPSGQIFSDNTIYHNNFIDNDDHVSENRDSDWYTEYPIGGNFWSDYNGTDIYSGPKQNNNGSDGIGDTPYKIDRFSEDKYPLMEPIDAIPPVAEAGKDVSIKVGEEVVLNGSRSYDDEGIVSYQWEFEYEGERVNLTGEKVEFTFDRPETYRVALNVSDEAGNYDTDSLLVTVVDDKKPVADAGQDISVDEGETTTFNASDSWDNVEIYNYTWFIEGTELYGEDIEYTFEKPGIYEVILEVFDVSGNSDTDTVNVTVNDITAPTADAGDDRTVGVEEEFTLDASGSSDNVGIANYEWNLGDDKTLSGEIIEYEYDELGEYFVKLTVTDEAGNSASDTITITVVDDKSPEADFDFKGELKTGKKITFDAARSYDNLDIVSYEWDFGDGETASGKVEDHEYDKKGTYEVKLTVTDEAGNTDTDVVEIKVKEGDGGKSDGIGSIGYLVIALIIGMMISVAIYYLKTKD